MKYACTLCFALATAFASSLQGQSAPSHEFAIDSDVSTSASVAEGAAGGNFLTPSQGGLFNGPEAERAVGDWRGWRSALERHGIKPSAYWTGIVSGNPVGGEKQGHVTAVDDTFLVFDFDLGILIGWKNAKMTVSLIDRGGRGLTNNYIHSQYNVQQTVGGQAPFFYQMQIQKSVNNDRLLLKAGRFSASDDMNASPIYGLYLNNGFDGDIRNVLFDTQFSAYPFATWAGYARYKISEKVQLQSAVYQTWSDIFSSKHHGLDWGIHDNDGIITMHQLAWSPTVKKGDPVRGEGLPGHYWLGSTYSPWKGYTPFLSSTKVGNSYGFYVHGDQMVHAKYPGSRQGITVWSAAAYYPQQHISIVPLQINAGLVDQGRFGHRTQDRTILGVLYGQFSRDYAKSIVSAGKGNPTHEMLLEVGHRIQMTKYSFIQPDVQWVIRPSGTGKIPNAVVFGAEMGVVF